MNEVFETALQRVLTEAPIDTKIDKDKFDDLTKALRYLGDVVPNAQDISLEVSPVFSHGSLSIELNELSVDSEPLESFSSLLDWCDAFEVLPLTNGKIKVMITINNLYEK